MRVDKQQAIFTGGILVNVYSMGDVKKKKDIWVIVMCVLIRLKK